MIGIPINLIGIVAAAYLLGSIPWGVLITRVFGRADIRESGSGNIGATNVARVAGPAAGILTLVLDTAKGFAAVWLAARYSNDSATWMMVAGLVALAGHCFPVWLKFKGGKGVAAALGVFLAFARRRHSRRWPFSRWLPPTGNMFRSAPSPLLLPCRC